MTRSRLVPVLGVVLTVVLHICTVHALQLVRITSPAGDYRDLFGFSVALVTSIPGEEFVAVGAPVNGAHVTNTGVVHLFARDAGGLGNWGLLTTLRSDDLVESDAFGFSVAAVAVAVVAGAPQGTSRGIRSGAAYLFTVSNGEWTQFAKLEPDDGAAGDRFGHAVAISTGVGAPVIVVGAPANDAAYVFESDPADPRRVRLVTRLVPGDAQPGSGFGSSVAASGDLVIIGAPMEDGALVDAGAAYIFSRDRGGPGRWGQVARLTKTDQFRGSFPPSLFGRENVRDQFGTSVAISGTMAVVGAPGENGPGRDTGAAYVFYRDAGGPDRWGQAAELTASGAAGIRDLFGFSVAIGGNRILVGAPDNDVDRLDAGAVYLFGQDQGGEDAWGRQSSIRVGGDEAGTIAFGRAVSLSDSGSLGVAGAPFNLDESAPGTAFILEHMATLQTHSSAADSFIRRNEPNRNEGANFKMRVNSSGLNRAVVSFPELPNVERLVSATLVLTIQQNSNNWGPDGRGVDAFRVTPFPEGNGRSAGIFGLERTRGEGAGITWNCWEDLAIENGRPDCGMTGMIRDPVATPVVHRNQMWGEVAWDVTADVADRTFAWMIRKTNESRSGEVWYYTKESAQLIGNPDLAPRLLLDFDPLSERLDAGREPLPQR